MKAFLILLSLTTFLNVSAVKAQDLSLDGDVFESAMDQGVASFCRDRLAVLRNAMRRASIESSRGNAELSATVLLNGLKQAAAQISPRYSNTLTSKAILRGVRITNNLNAIQGDRQKARTVNMFLIRYYRFIQDVSTDLDVPYFQPGRCGFCNSVANEEFEENFVVFAQEQLSMVLDSMTTDSHGIIYPVGSPKILLTAIKLTTAAMARDLNESLWASQYACKIRELREISLEAASYLRGTSYSADDFEAIQELVSRSRDVSDSIERCN